MVEVLEVEEMQENVHYEISSGVVASPNENLCNKNELEEIQEIHLDVITETLIKKKAIDLRGEYDVNGIPECSSYMQDIHSTLIRIAQKEQKLYVLMIMKTPNLPMMNSYLKQRIQKTLCLSWP